MNLIAVFILILFMLFNLGCTNSQQELLSRGPQFSGIVYKSLSDWEIPVPQGSTSFNLTAQCDKRVKFIEWSWDHQNSWEAVASDAAISNADLDCSDGNLSFTVAVNSILTRVASPSVGASSVDVYLRGSTFAGYTLSSHVAIVFIEPTGTPTPAPTSTPLPSPIQGATPTSTPTPASIATPTPTPTSTPTNTPVPTPTATATATPTSTLTPTPIPPVVSGIAPPNNGTYGLNGGLTFGVTFSETVTVTGNPRLVLAVDPGGLPTQYAVYSGGGGSNTLSFTWSVPTGADDYNGIVVSATIDTDGGSIQSGTSVDADLNTGVWLTNLIFVDGVLPAAPTSISLINPVSSPSNIATPTFTVGAVVVNDVITLHNASNCGGTPSGSNAATGASVTITLSPALTVSNTYTLYAKATDLAANVSPCSTVSYAYTYDGLAPNVTSYNQPTAANYSTGQTLTYSFSFSENVTYSSTPNILLGFSSGTITVPLASLSGNLGSFTYSIQAGDFDSSSSFSVTGFVPNFSDLAGNPITIWGAPTNNVVINSTANLSFTSSIVNFGSVTYPSGKNVVLTLNNTGSGSATTITPTILSDTYSVFSSSNNCGGTLAANASCSVTISYTNPGEGSFTGPSLSVSYYNGAANQSVVSSTFTVTGIAGTITVDPFFGVTYKNWSKYVKYNHSDLFSITPTACAGTETGGYRARNNSQDGCLHAGEMRRVNLASETDCSALQFFDSLDAFDWNCRIISGSVVYYSTGLRKNKRLSDLILWDSNISTSSWKTVGAKIKKGNYIVYKASPSQLWTNTVQTHSVTASPVTITAASTIYYVPKNFDTGGIIINADEVGIAINPSAKLFWNNSTNTNLNNSGEAGSNLKVNIGAGGQKFLWIEGLLNGSSGTSNWSDYGLFLYNVDYSRIRYVGTENSAYGIKVTGTSGSTSQYNLFEMLSSSDNSFEGLTIDNTVESVFSGLNANNNGTGGSAAGLLVSTNADKNTFVNVLSNENSGAGINLGAGSSTRNSFSFVTANANGSTSTVSGFYTYMSPFDLNQAVFLRNYFSGVKTELSAGSVLSQLISASSVSYTIFDDSNNFYYHNMVFGATSNCYMGGSTPGLNGSCAASNSSPNVINSNFNKDAVYVGKPSSDDSFNSETSNSITGSAIKDFLRFLNPFRSWALNNTTTFSGTGLGPCQGATTCTLWDWSLASGGPLTNVSSSFTSTNSAFTSSALCPAAVDGDTKYITDGLTRKWLVNAIEIIGTLNGNGNGFCESGEECVYASNFGAYQGGDQISTTTCNFSGTQVNGVTMHEFATPAVTYANWNPADKGANVWVGRDLQTASITISNISAIRGDIGKSSGKYYFEVTLESVGGNGTSGARVGIATSASPTYTTQFGATSAGYALDGGDGKLYYNGTPTLPSPVLSFAAGDTVMIAVDLTSATKLIWFGVNGVWNNSSDPSTGAGYLKTVTAGTYFPSVGFWYPGVSFRANFGQRPFVYQVPSGFTAGWY